MKKFIGIALVAMAFGLWISRGKAQTPPAPPAPPAGPLLTLAQVVEKLQANYKTINTYQAQFDQELFSTSQGRVVSKGSGLVLFKKPSKMIWHYRAPEEHFYITDGNTLWDYSPGEKEVYVMSVKDALYKSFLLGLGDLKKDFELSFHGGRPKSQDGFYQVDLVPRDQAERETIGTITLYVDPANFLVRTTETVDALGNRNTIKFKAVALNPPLDDALFRFTPPPGVQVIRAENAAPESPPR